MSTNQIRSYGDLKITLTSKYEFQGSDVGSGTARAASFWDPWMVESEFGEMRPVGTVCVNHYNDINGKQASILVGGASDGPNPPVKSPIGFTEIWSSRGMGGKNDVTMWRLIAPPGYVALGDIVIDVTRSPWETRPNLERNWCLRADLVRRSIYRPNSFWDDTRGGGMYDCSVWPIIPEPIVGMGNKNIPINAGCFRGHQSYAKPSTSLAYVPVLPCEKEYKKFYAQIPKVTQSSIPSTGDEFSLTEQCRVILPFISFFDSTDERSLDYIENPFCELSRSIAWKVEGVWVNGGVGEFSRTKELKCGISSSQTSSMTHSAGIEISSSAGIGFANFGISLNYQFTAEKSSSFTEYKEQTVTEKFDVPGKNAKVLFSKHIWITALRLDGGQVVKEIEFVANDDVYFAGCPIE